MQLSGPDTINNSFYKHRFEIFSEKSTPENPVKEQVDTEILVVDRYYEMTQTADKICTLHHLSQKTKQLTTSEARHNDALKLSSLITEVKDVFPRHQYVVLISHLNRSILIENSIIDPFCMALAQDNGYKLIAVDNSRRNADVNDAIAPLIWETKPKINNGYIQERRDIEVAEKRRYCVLF